MEFSCFASLLKEEVEKKTGAGHRVRLNDVVKNNGVMLKGLTVMQDGAGIFPVIYLNGYYDAYKKGIISIERVVDDIMGRYEWNKAGKMVNIRDFLNFNAIRDGIVYKLVNTEKNSEMLENVPHMDFLDLSLIFQCTVAKEKNGKASILVHNAHLKLWDVTPDDLYRAACINTPRLYPYEIKSMKEAICEIMQEESPDTFDQERCMEQLPDSAPMYVLSNNVKTEGACCMLYPDLLGDFADELESDFYIIPSSIHECLLLPAEKSVDAEEIKAMIKEINETQVKEEDILSDSLYFYDRENDKVTIL